MQLNTRDHDVDKCVVVYTGLECPLCEIEAQKADLKSEVEELEGQFSVLEG